MQVYFCDMKVLLKHIRKIQPEQELYYDIGILT